VGAGCEQDPWEGGGLEKAGMEERFCLVKVETSSSGAPHTSMGGKG